MQVPPKKKRRCSNLLTPELGIDVNEWDTMKLLVLLYLVLNPLARFFLSEKPTREQLITVFSYCQPSLSMAVQALWVLAQPC